MKRVVKRGSGTAPALEPSSLVARAEDLLSRMEPRQAAAAYREALSAKPDDPTLLDALAEVLCHLGEDDEARALLTRSAELAPEGGFAKWMLLGQLQVGASAAACFSRGVALLERALGGGGGGDPVLRRKLSEAHCALAELYLTDLCDEPDAEGQCARFTDAALAADEGNPEAHQVTASLRLCQQRPADARAHLARMCALLRALEEEEEEEEGGGGEAAGEEVGETGGGRSGGGTRGSGGGGGEMETEAAGGGAASPSPAVAALGPPPYHTRLAAAQMCMEAELYADAGALLDTLLGEDDTNMEVWFLAGEAALLGGDAATAVDLLATADAMLDAALSSRGAGGGKAGGGGGGRAVMAASALASSASVVEFTQEAIQALLETPPGALREQLSMVRALLAKAREAAPAAPGAGASGGGAGGGRA